MSVPYNMIPYINPKGDVIPNVFVEDTQGVTQFKTMEEENAWIESHSPDGVADPIEYPDFFEWRLKRLEELGLLPEELLIYPGMPEMDYFKEPADPTTTRCPRCFSTNVRKDDRYIWCRSCHFNETLDTIDY